MLLKANLPIGQYLQILIGIASLLGMWYTTVDKVVDNIVRLESIDKRIDRMEERLLDDLDPIIAPIQAVFATAEGLRRSR